MPTKNKVVEKRIMSPTQVEDLYEIIQKKNLGLRVRIVDAEKKAPLSEGTLLTRTIPGTSLMEVHEFFDTSQEKVTLDYHRGLPPCRGAIALCSLGLLGLITCDEPEEVTYEDGTTGMAWTGIHLKDKTFIMPFGPSKDEEITVKIGDKWSSKRPRVLCYTDEIYPYRPRD